MKSKSWNKLRETLEMAERFYIDQIKAMGPCDHDADICVCGVVRDLEIIQDTLLRRSNTMNQESKSRAEQWEAAASEAAEHINHLLELQEQAQEWYNNMPENPQGTPTGWILQDVLGVDLDSALSIIEEAGSIDFPRGYGRD